MQPSTPQPDRTDKATPLRPDPWLLGAAPILLHGVPGPILDLACGSGKNALWLAHHGVSVIGLDANQAAIISARRHAANLPVRFTCKEIQANDFPEGPWSAICVFHFLDRALFPLLERELARDGHLVCKTHLNHPLRGPQTHPQRPAYLLQSGELLRSFPNLSPLYYAEWAEAGHAYAALVARRTHSS